MGGRARGGEPSPFQRDDAAARDEGDAHAPREERQQRRRARVEPAGIGAEGGHHQARAVMEERWPGEAAAAQGDARLGVIVAADLARLALSSGDVAEDQRGEAKLARDDPAADRRRQLGIVIAGDPDPVGEARRDAARRSRSPGARRSGPSPSWKLSPRQMTRRRSGRTAAARRSSVAMVS